MSLFWWLMVQSCKGGGGGMLYYYQNKISWNLAFCHQNHLEDLPDGEVLDISLFPSKGLIQSLLKRGNLKLSPL